MANVIKHKRGSGSDPVASDLVVGEVAIRTDVGKLFTKMDNGSVAEIAGGGSDIAINTLSSSSGTGGGSATFNGSAYRFTLSQPPSVSAYQLLVSINGVIQKPVSGTGQPSEGFAVDGTDIILGDAPETGADFFILTFKSLGVSEPADNSVTSAKIVDGTILNVDINASAAIAGTKISPDFGSQNIVTTGKVGINETALSSFNSIADDLVISQASGSAGITIRSGTSNTGVLAFTDGANTSFRGDLRYDHNGDYMRFSTDGDERMRITSAGNVGIGTTSPVKKLHIADAGDVGIALQTTNANTNKEMWEITCGGNASNEADLVFQSRTDAGSGGIEAMRLSSSGRVGIGTASPAYILDVVGDSGGLFSASTNSTQGQISIVGKNSSGSVSAISRIKSHPDGSSNQSHMAFETRNSSATMVEAMRITSDQKVGVGTSSPDRTIHCHNSSNTTNVRAKFSNGTTGEGASDGFEIGINGSDPAQAVLVNYENSPMAFFTNATERVRVQAGGGISFNGDTAAANALDDYEEGEHTLTTNSNLTINASYNKADYTKVGNMVTVTFNARITAVSSNDVLSISMPFANRNESAPRMCQAVGSVMHKNVNTGNVGMIPYLDAGSSSLKFYQLADDASWTVINNADLNANDELYVTITYKTAT